MEEEAAQKKQFRLKKKTFFIFLGLFVVLTFLGGYILFFYRGGSDFTREPSLYEELFDYCDYKDEGQTISATCYSFINDEYVKEALVDTCLSVRVATQDGVFKDVDICLPQEKLEWENPYEDYSLSVPVIMQIDYKKNFWGIYEVDSVDIILMEDEVSAELFQKVHLLDPSFVGIKFQRQAEIERKGYYVTNKFNPENSEEVTRNLLVFREARIISYDKVDNQLLFNFTVLVNGEEKDLTILGAEGLEFVSIGPEGLKSQEGVPPGFLSSDIIYTLYLSNAEVPFFEEDFIEGDLDTTPLLSIGETFLLETILMYEVE